MTRLTAPPAFLLTLVFLAGCASKPMATDLVRDGVKAITIGRAECRKDSKPGSSTAYLDSLAWHARFSGGRWTVWSGRSIHGYGFENTTVRASDGSVTPCVIRVDG